MAVTAAASSVNMIWNQKKNGNPNSLGVHRL